MLLAELPHLPHRLLGCPGEPERRFAAVALDQAGETDPHRVDEAAVSATGPVADAVGFEQTDLELRYGRFQVKGTPESGETAADHDHVEVLVALKPGEAGLRPRLVNPVSECLVDHLGAGYR